MTESPDSTAPGAVTETTTVWEFLFPEVKKETAKASEVVREDLSTFLTRYAQNLDDLYQAIDQAPCRTWGLSSAPVGLKYPFPTERTLDEFFQGHVDDLIYPVKVLTRFIHFVDSSVARAQKEFYPALATFGETVEELPVAHEILDTECGVPTGDLEEMTAAAIPMLSQLANFLPEVFAVGQKFVDYVFYLYSDENEWYNQFFKTTVLASAFGAIGRLLKMIYTLSTLVSDNPALRDGWEHLLKMISGIKKEPGTYEAQTEDAEQCETAATQILRIVFCGDMLNLFLSKQLAPLAAKPSTKTFAAALERYLLDEISLWTKLVKTGKYSDRESDICDLTLLLHLLTLYNSEPKPKIVALLWDTLPLTPVVKLYHFVVFSSVNYLQEKLPDLVRQVIGPDAGSGVSQKVQQALTKNDQSLGLVCMKLFSMFSQWQSVCHTKLIRGLNIAYMLKTNITKTLDMHSSLNKPIDKQYTEHLGRMIELLKAVHVTFFLNQSGICHNIPLQTEEEVKRFKLIEKKVGEQIRKKNYKSVRTRVSNMLLLAIHCVDFFSSDFSPICLEIIGDLFSCKVFAGLQLSRQTVLPVLRKLKMLQHYSEYFDDACNCSFLVDFQDLFPLYLGFIRTEPRRVLFLAQAMNDVADMARDDQTLYAKWETSFTKMMRDEFISPILSQIETELRFHSHEHLDVSERNPLKQSFASFDKFLSIPPFRLCSKFIDIHYEASYYFSRVFYNETTVAPQVWETYAEMANLAKRIYGIHIMDCHIPGAMMQQEIDVLEIMRHINKFVAVYNYDLNSQIFVQRSEDSHHIAIVGIPHIFSSYRCHGIGIMNTTVDFTYRFLRMKFNTFSKFLFDDTIKSRLINDITWFEQHKEECEGLWPYKSADKMVTDMKRLGLSQDGLSVLDHFRVLITEIGNALGFVRMVRNGGARFLNNAIGFVYDEDAELSFHGFAEEVQLPQATMDATTRLDSVVGKLKELFSGGDSFFKLLVDVFSGPFRDKKNSHLHNFYAIIPALSLSYLNHISVLKDNAQKQNKNSSFSDDGFPMGIAYILKLLDQDALFDSIHWFASLQKHAEEEKKEAETATTKKSWGISKGSNAKQTMKLTLAMIARRVREYELLETTVHSARILFN